MKYTVFVLFYKYSVFHYKSPLFIILFSRCALCLPAQRFESQGGESQGGLTRILFLNQKKKLLVSGKKTNSSSIRKERLSGWKLTDKPAQDDWFNIRKINLSV
jgi:hypothetical protein